MSRPEAVAAARASLREFLRFTDAVLASREPDAAALDAVSSGFAFGEVEALAAQYSEMGYRRSGAVRVVGLDVRKVVLGDTEIPTVVLEACLDGSEVDTLDRGGNSLKDLMYNPDGPVAHVYGVRYRDAAWHVVTHSIPAGSSCSDKGSNA